MSDYIHCWLNYQMKAEGVAKVECRASVHSLP